MVKKRISLKNVKTNLRLDKTIVKTDNGSYLLKCDFCLQDKVRINRNFYIPNWNKVQFWTQKEAKKTLVCFECLFGWKEIDIRKSRKGVFYVYKNRYNKSETHV